jgi:hypothetical protein
MYSSEIRTRVFKRAAFNKYNNASILFIKKDNDFTTAPWRRGKVDIASASGTRRPGFESRQGIRFLGKHSSAVVYKMT